MEVFDYINSGVLGDAIWGAAASAGAKAAEMQRANEQNKIRYSFGCIHSEYVTGYTRSANVFDCIIFEGYMRPSHRQLF